MVWNVFCANGPIISQRWIIRACWCSIPWKNHGHLLGGFPNQQVAGYKLSYGYILKMQWKSVTYHLPPNTMAHQMLVKSSWRPYPWIFSTGWVPIGSQPIKVVHCPYWCGRDKVPNIWANYHKFHRSQIWMIRNIEGFPNPLLGCDEVLPTNDASQPFKHTRICIAT